MNQYETYPDAVRDLQTRLRRLAEDDSRLPQVPIDGVYASLTRQAVEDFQRLSGLTVTGIADPVTWAAVQQAYDALIARIDPPRGIFPFPLTRSFGRSFLCRRISSAQNNVLGRQRFWEIVKNLFPKRFLTGAWGSAPLQSILYFGGKP